MRARLGRVTCMSIRAWRISLYTEPRKPRGTESWVQVQGVRGHFGLESVAKENTWKRRPLTMTRLPTVMVPARISLEAMIMMVERAAEKMRLWPKLRKARDQLVLREAVSKATRDLSYCSASYSSLLKYLTVS